MPVPNNPISDNYSARLYTHAISPVSQFNQTSVWQNPAWDYDPSISLDQKLDNPWLIQQKIIFKMIIEHATAETILCYNCCSTTELQPKTTAPQFFLPKTM